MEEEKNKDLEKDFEDLIRKYTKILSAGDIVDTVMAVLVSVTCCAAQREDEIRSVRGYFIRLVNYWVNKSEDYFLKHPRR